MSAGSIRRTPPELTDDQRREASARAVEARARRCELRGMLSSGGMTFAELLDEPDAARMLVRQAILALPGYGRARTARLMGELGISERRRVAGLGVRQRAALLERLGGDGR